MSGVRSQALEATAARAGSLADEVRAGAQRLVTLAARVRPPPVSHPGDAAVFAQWVRLEAESTRVAGPAGLWGEALALDGLALRLLGAARVYREVERAVGAMLDGVRCGADVAGRAGWLEDLPAAPVVTPVPATLVVDRSHGFGSAADLVAAGEGLDGARVRVIEVARGDGGSAWVVVVPGTQEWSPAAGANPFDLTTDVRALTGDATVAAAGVTAALRAARARAGSRSAPGDPVLLVGHSQGGILAAALASDPGFRRGNAVTHLVTTGAPVGLFPVPRSVHVLSVERGDDPVPRLDLSPNPESGSWVTVRTPGGGLPADVRQHRLEGYVDVLRVAEGAPRGTVVGLDPWQASAGDFLHTPVRSVSEAVVLRGEVPST